MKRVPAWKRITPWTPEWIAYLRTENRRLRTTFEKHLTRTGCALDSGICGVEYYTESAQGAHSSLESLNLDGRLIDLYERQMLGIASQEDNQEVETILQALNLGEQ